MLVKDKRMAHLFFRRLDGLAERQIARNFIPETRIIGLNAIKSARIKQK